MLGSKVIPLLLRQFMSQNDEKQKKKKKKKKNRTPQYIFMFLVVFHPPIFNMFYFKIAYLLKETQEKTKNTVKII